jgi:Tol biopolymer transport system component
MRKALVTFVLLAAVLAVGSAQGVTPGKNGLIYFENFNENTQSSDIYSINAGGSGLKPLTNSQLIDETEPSVSPNGRLVAYLSDAVGDNQTFHLYLMTSGGGSQHALAGGGVAHGSPAFSPRGNQIAFSRCVAIDAGSGGCTNAQIAVIGSNGRGVKVLSRATSPAVVDSRPAWRPNGKSLVFQRVTQAGVVSMWSINANGSGLKRMVNDGSDINLNPSYAPNGAQVVYASDAGGHEALYRVNGNGHAKTRLFAETPDPADSTTGSGTENPAVSPNGQQIVYTAAGELWTATINGTNRKRLTTDGGDEADWARG